MTTVTALLDALADDQVNGVRTATCRLSWAEHHLASRRRARVLAEFDGHVGVLADNGIEFSLLFAAAAVGGRVLVGLNPNRRGQALRDDIRRTDCAVVLTDARHAELLDPDPGVPVLRVDDPAWLARVEAADPVPARPAADDDLLMLIFTSGTSGEPKAVRCTHAKFADAGTMLAGRFGLGREDTVYQSMPMFHSNALIAGWSVAVAAGANLALRERFSASGFLPDVRCFGATYANYVGRPLSYVLATPERPDDADNPLRIAYGNEGNPNHVAAFARRFDCRVIDAYGSTEGGVAIGRTPDTPPRALGPLTEGLAVLHPETGRRCPPARFDEHGRLTNPEEAIGELVNVSGTGTFAGYYGDPEAESERTRDGCYHTGDLVYVDTEGYCYFAGRTGDWLRVDGENLGTAPIERVLGAWPHAAEVAVYGVPDDSVGDQVAAAIVPTPGTEPTPEEFAAFVAAAPDLGTKQLPRYVRLCDRLPRTATFKVRKTDLRAEGTDARPLWIREGDKYRPA